ncbi:hypothetical protein AGMMS49587_07170 [Spirochaetia bacterium]|nr:hypothetical protein AGMMS49587_07170 [Spirochaetia bacterium]
MAINSKKDNFLSPTAIFIYYIVLSALGIMAFRFIFMGENPPLPPVARKWRFAQGAFELLSLFPALAMTALVIPFGLMAESRETGEGALRFSPVFFKRLTGPIITAITAAVIYGLLFFLVLPQVQDYRANMRFEGQLYQLSRERAEEHAALGEWSQVTQFINLCERIWPGSPGLAGLKVEADIRTEELRSHQDEENAGAPVETGYRDAVSAGIPGQRQPVSDREAITQAEKARQEERYYDAHWLATMAGRQAKPGSPEQAEAARVASLAWNSISSLAPSAYEKKLSDLYHLKQSGYEAMVAGEWIRAYYIFLELSKLTPADPDVANFLAKSDQETHEVAFFTDEMDRAAGEALTEAVYSIPIRPQTGGVFGRGVLRFSSISYFSDVSYGFGLEFVSFDAAGRPETRFEAPYAKIIPMILNDQQRIVVMMRALDRYDKTKRWEPVWESPAGDTQIILDMNYENFLLLSRVKRGVDNLSVGELFTAAKNLGPYGYIPQVFEAEAIYRLCEPLIFLPIAIFTIIIGWRYRAKKRPRYIAVPMLFVLPLVFNGLVHFYRHILNTLGTWTVLSLGFSSATVIFPVGIGVLFVISLISLAFQHE